MEKAKIYNVIILDKSGSMESIKKQAVDGVNETLGAIRSAQEKTTECEHYVTVVTFCGCEVKKIVDAKAIRDVENISCGQYSPCCMTPLYDAIGMTISQLHANIDKEVKTAVSVTVITDGYENASREFTGNAVKELINKYKDEGWLFAYIGADHDVESVAFSLSINNTMRFEKSQEGTQEMSRRYSSSLHNWATKAAYYLIDPTIAENDDTELKKCNENFFDCE